MSTGRTSRSMLAATAVGAVTLLLLVAGCGGSSSSESSSTSSSGASTEAEGGGSSLSTAKDIVSEALKVPEFTLKAPAFAASKASGKKIFDVVFRSEDAYIAATTKQMEEIAKERGINFVPFNTKGTPSEWAAGIEQGIAQKADLIMIETDPHAVVPQLKKAKQANIPVLLLHWYATGEPVPSDVAPYIAAQVTAPFYPTHRVDVAYAASESSGSVDGLIIESSDITPSAGIVEHMEQDFEELCGSGCKFKTVDVPATQWATKMETTVRSALNQDPNINWVFPLYDAMTLTAAPAIQAAGGTGKVQVATFNGTPEVMNLMNTGEILAGDVGENVNWLGYAFMDQAMRILSGTEPIADGDEGISFRLFTKENIAEAGTPPQAEKGYGDAYVTGYESLWNGGS